MIIEKLRRGRSMTRCERKIALFGGAVARIDSAFIDAHRKGFPIYRSAARPRRRLCASPDGASRALPCECKHSHLLRPIGRTQLRWVHRHVVPMKNNAPGDGSSPHPGVVLLVVTVCLSTAIYHFSTSFQNDGDLF